METLSTASEKELVVTINQLHGKIEGDYKKAKEYYQNALHKARELGEKLEQMKSIIPDGEWEKWCKDNLIMSFNATYQYRKIYQHWDFLIEHSKPMGLLEQATESGEEQRQPTMSLNQATALIREEERKKTQADTELAISLLNEGRKIVDIAEQTGIHRNTITNLKKQLEAKVAKEREEQERLATELRELKAGLKQAEDLAYRKGEALWHQKEKELFELLKTEAWSQLSTEQQHILEEYQHYRNEIDHIKDREAELQDEWDRLRDERNMLENMANKTAEAEQRRITVQKEIEGLLARKTALSEELQSYQQKSTMLKMAQEDERTYLILVKKFNELMGYITANILTLERIDWNDQNHRQNLIHIVSITENISSLLDSLSKKYGTIDI